MTDDAEGGFAERSSGRGLPSPRREAAPACLHQLFERSAARHPATVAVSFGPLEVPYRELDRRAEALARRLRLLGVGPECLVGLSAERSVEMLVGILGVLKAGAAYLPLDPDYPEERLRFMWEDSRSIPPPGSPSVLLGLRRLAARLEPLVAGGAGRLVLLDEEAGGPEEDDDRARPRRPAASPRNLAYVIYTSGSTGRPKGVMIEHRGVVEVVRHAARALRVGPGSRFLQLASLSFDASVLEVFTAFGTGARLVLTPRETLLSGEALGEALRRDGITSLAIPPSLLDRVPDGVELPALRSIVVGGEACSAATARRWAPGRVLVNAYAPTEATIYTTAQAVAAPFDRPPAMGRPIPGSEVRVLDDSGRPVPDGEVGELCLGGPGLARGYGSRPALTAERFVPDGRAGADAPAGSRLYRSGDLGRRLRDGSLDFAGRADHQVKVRGLRIELGEIEAALTACPGVRQAVVARREDVPGEARLVAYLVTGPGGAPSVSELRGLLGERLPEAMVPSAFVVLDAFPRTPTGKIDRRALPAPGPERPDLSTAYAAPEGPLETALAAIWGDLLGLAGVGADDDLFELGGHSLVVAQIANRVRQELGLEVPLLAPFEHPTVRRLAAWLAERAASAAGAAAGVAPALRLPPVEPAPRDRPIPLSFPQEGIWFLLQLAPESIAYSFQFSLRLRGELSLHALAAALSELVRRHEVLRTTFPAEDGRPVQRIHAPFPARVPVVDLSRLPAAERERRMTERVRSELARGFDVTRLPLLRWTLFRLAAGDHLLLQVEHHFVHDGWSLSVYLRELRDLYAAFRDGRPSPLSEPAIQYADFACWQRRFALGEVLDAQLDYWRAKLAGSPPLLELPADRPRPRQASFRGGCLRVDVEPALYREVRAFGRRRGATLFMTMLAAFEALLHRYTGQRDLVLGSGLANRRLREAEGLVGMVVNTLVLRTGVDGAMTFREVLEEVRRTTLELHVHQDVPFETLVERLQPDRDLSRNPLFQVLFSFHDAPVPDLDLPGLSAELFEWHNGSAKTDLNVVVKPVAEQRVGRGARAEDAVLTMVWEYSSDLFDRATVERMWRHYRSVLAAVVADPDAPVDRLPLLSAAERHELLREWNDTAVPYPRERSIPELFEEVAARCPDAVAVRQGERWWSYAELERRSELVAAHLAAAGAGPESLVGIAAERSPEMIAGLLGILRAGGAYLPLDPGYPEERLRFMLEDGRVPVLLAGDGTADRLPAAADGEAGPLRLSLEAAVAGGGADEAAPPPVVRSGPRSLVYVLYTSGSTGRPKGVAVEHRSVVRLVRGARFAAMTEDEVFLQLAPVPFDASTLEIWGALLNGGRLEVFPPETPSLAELGRGIEASRVTTLWLTAGLFHQMVESELPRLAGVRCLLAGGDVLSPPHVARVRAVLGPGQALVNGYGPTEGTTFTCCHPMGPAEAAGDGAPIPVGRPISSTRVYLVAPAPGGGLEPVPPGVPGELLVGGDGVARGYLARPALTAAGFVPDPFGPEDAGAPGARLYRTGDLARWLPGGAVEFLGRIDGQVKLRGFRIELGEVEAALQELPEVAAAAVAPRSVPGTAGAAERRLVAWVVPRRPAEPPDPARLRRALEARLPDHMVPADFVLLDALPLSPTGKVDRRALPDPERREPAAAAAAPDRAPRTPTEELVAALWRQVLGLERVDVEEDFFQAGGHSLLATRLLARLRDATGAEIPLSDLFDAPTVAGLALRVEARLRSAGEGAGEEPGAAAGAVSRRTDRGPAPLSFAQERLWFLDRLTPGDASYNIARALRLEGPLDAPALAGALAAVARRHEVLRTRFDARPGRPVQVADLAPPPLPVVDLGRLSRSRAAATAAELGRAESRRPFDLARGPVVRTTLLRLSSDGDPDAHVLLLTLHHIAADGWSMAILYRELEAAYRRLAAPRPGEPRADLPALPVQYADFAVWQREHLSGERLERLLAWWRERLAGAPPATELPTDRPRPRVLSHRGARAALPLAPALPGAAAELALRRGATPFMVYLAGFAALLHRYTGRTDVVLGTPMANRGRTEVEGLVGFFANSLVLRLDAGGDPPFEELLARVRAAVLGAYAHQEIPFEKLVDELAPERDLSRAPLFQVSFQVEDGAGERLDLPGLAVARLDLARAETKSDLDLELAPGPAGLRARAQYSTDLFDPTRVLRLLAHLGRLLEAAVGEPGLPLSRLPLLAPAERHQVVAEWNDTDRPSYRTGPDAEPLHRLFEAQAARTPDAVALSFEDRQLTYRALEGASGRLARRLHALGVGPDVLVGACLERSVEMVVGLLAVLRAGGAYVPLDPEYPAERLAFMVEDSEAPVILTLERLRHLVPPPTGVERTLLVLDGEPGREPSAGSDVAAAAEPAEVGLDHLIYAIFTSGSTGRPKGAMNTHRGLLYHVLWMREDLGFDADDRVLQKTPLIFDPSAWELLLPLITGARVVLARPGGHRDPAYLTEVVQRERVTLLDFVPSMLPAFLGQPGVEGCTSLRRVIAGGEALSPSLVAAFNRIFGCGLDNSYGPTEASIGMTAWRCPRQGEPEVVPIGRPIAEATAHLADPRLRPVPVGVPGELLIGGDAPGRGYLRRPGLTAERFVPDPFGGRPGGRLYRTGDLCRTLPSGDVEYLDRIDLQLKIRGQRIELGEIETALAAQPGVSAAAVVPRQRAAVAGGGPPQVSLVAFVAAAPGAAPRPDELRRRLRSALPEAMVPSAVVVLDELPIAISGKVDRAALARRPLPDPRQAGEEEREARVLPRTALERALARIWEDVLEVPEVGVHDPFFHLGGNSITAAIAINGLQELLGETVHVVAIFEAPTVAGLAAWVEERHPEAAARLAARGGGVPGGPAIQRLPRPADGGPATFAPSFAQERLWFLDRMEPGRALYNLPVALRLTGALRRPVLGRLLAELVRRHETLRTTFPEAAGAPLQRVAPPGPVPLPVIDLSGLAPEAREREARRLAREDAEAPFDLARGPLFRARLLDLGAASAGAAETEREHRLLLGFHHIVADGWSMGVLLDEIAALYPALASGTAAALPPAPPVQYADFAAWQRGRLEGEVLERQLAYWRERLAGAPEVLELPTDRPRPAVQAFRGGRVPFRLSRPEVEALAALGKGSGSTLFMVLLGGFLALLARATGQRDLVVGTPVAGRTRREAEGLIGFFVNTLALRADLSGDPAFGDVLAAARKAALGAFDHQELPFERLVQELVPERSLGHTPLFQVLLALQGGGREARTLPGLGVEVLDTELRAAKFDLVLSVGETPDGLRGSWQYDAALFDPTTVERLARHLRTLLAGAAASPETPLSRLPLLSAAERHAVVAEWNDSAAAYPRERSIPELFSEVAARRPDAVALRQGERWWSYEELARRSCAVAARLAAEGVGPEVLVGLAAERSPEMVAGLLGILRAGGAYLPLDPEYPAERLAFMVEDARAPVLLASEALAGRFAALGAGARVVSLDEAMAGGGGAPAPDAAEAGPPSPVNSLAYVLYTSGSTGRPKGVAVEHRSVVRLVRGHGCAGMGAGIGEDEVFLQLAPVPFDASTLELWGALLNGGRLELPAPGVPSLAELGRRVEASRVTALFLTTGLFNQIVDAELPRLAAVRELITGGEGASPGHMARARAARRPGQTLVHAYGPTEGTTFTTCHRMGPAPAGDGGAGAPPIGRPVASTRAHLVTPGPGGGLDPVPAGVAGELYVGGDGVARGYLGRPARTAAAFVPDPFGEPGARLYRTGDLARRLPGGEIEFVGRIDRQVKLRGFRIEPGEVEAALVSHPAVRSAVAMVREDRPGDRRLVAYAAAAPGEAPEPAALRAHLAERLPDHMVPAACVVLPELPLDPNGKVDRKALPPPGLEALPAAERVTPRSPLEEVVAAAWAEVLGVPAPGVHDDFFDAGGHSLLATRLVSRLRDLTGVELPLRRLFEGPTVGALAAAVEELRRGEPARRPPVLARRPDGEPRAPLSFSQERLWFLDRFDPGSAVYNIPALFRLRGRLRAPLLARALGALARRHEALRTVFVEVDGRPFQEVRPAAARLPVIDLSGLPAAAAEGEAEEAARRSARQGFDLARGPVWSAWLLRLGEREHRLALAIHHVAADGWSLGVLLRELTALYDAWSRGGPSPLAELPIQYADFAAWQRSALGAGALVDQVERWRRRLEGAPRALELPTDRPRPPRQTYRAERVARTVAPELHDRLLALAGREGGTMFMLLLAALDTVLSRWSGQRDVLVGSPVAGRTRSEVEGLVGMFLNTLVLRLELEGDGGGAPTFRELLRGAREAALDAYAHQDVPFEMLLEALGVERELSRTPLFQVFLNVTNFPRDRVPLEDLEVEVLDGDAGVGSKFDLTLYAGPARGGLALNLIYNADLFDRARMEELLDQLLVLLVRAADDPDRPYTAYDLRTPAAAALLPAPDEELSDRFEGTVPEVFAARAAEAPERVALTGHGVTWTYGALDRGATRIARALAAVGVGRGDRAVIWAHRSPSLPLAVLGVLRAGAAYVILDPAHPARHLVELVERARPRAVVRLAVAGQVPDALEEALARLAPAADLELPPPQSGPLAPFRTGAPEAHAAAPGGDPDRPPAVPLGPDDHAVLTFTSGTTGVPKGILGRHGPLSHFIPWQRRRLGLSPDDRYTMLSGLAHDPLQRDMFTPLQTGATLCVPPADAVLQPARLFAWMERERTTVAHLTPAMGQLVASGAAEGSGTEGLAALRRAFFVGEQLSPVLVDELFRLAPGLDCFNYYGTTETQRAVGYFPVPRDAARRFRSGIPLGRGIADVQVLVLGPSGSLAGVSELGEIAVRSPHLARGYLHDPASTAARFTPDPFATEHLAGGRIYKTGDLGRYRPDGAVEFSTRADDQVQVRGFRVELGAVETALAGHPGVAEAAVAARPGPDGASYLVGYVVPPAGAAAPATEELRAYLAERLPAYMVPGVFVPLPALPLTRTSKVDRRALPDPGGLPAAGDFEPPASPVEELLAGIWRDLLRVDRTGANDDFFALGGHSLLATRVVSRLRAEVGLEVPLRTLFERPRLRDLALALEDLLLAGTGDDHVFLNPK